jgi:hypothetical protein
MNKRLLTAFAILFAITLRRYAEVGHLCLIEVSQAENGVIPKGMKERDSLSSAPKACRGCRGKRRSVWWARPISAIRGSHR